jgi:hypothetical protein
VCSSDLVRSEACLSLVKDLRFAMAGCAIPLQSGDLVVRVFLYLYRLDNFELLKKFVDILCSDDQEEALDVIVSSAEIWNEVKTSKILCCFMYFFFFFKFVIKYFYLLMFSASLELLVIMPSANW